MIKYNPKDKLDAQFDCLSHFVNHWYGFITEEREEFQCNSPMPQALLNFYKYYDVKRDNIMVQNRILGPDQLIYEGNRLTFMIENQGVYIWQTNVEGENPEVYISENVRQKHWLREEERLCGFLYQMLLFEAMVGAKYHAYKDWISKDKLNSIINKWTLAPFKPLRWPGYPSQLFYIDNAIAFTFPNFDHFTFECGSNDSNAINFMHEFTDDTWAANINRSG
jgi:hypothetical protein